MSSLSDHDLHALLSRDYRAAWRVFVDQYTPLILGVIARAGVSDVDDAGDVYALVCDRLAADHCARLKKHNPAKGPLGGWVTVFVRHTVVDWVRSRAGRRRLFAAIEELDIVTRRVFELFYWEERRASEIVELLHAEFNQAIALSDVLAALQRIDAVMTDRHRRQLLALVARTRYAKSLENEVADGRLTLVAGSNPEQQVTTREVDALLARALRALPHEDAAIVRLTFVHGWSREQVERALHLQELTPEHLNRIVRRLAEIIASLGLRRDDLPASGLGFLEEPAP